MSKEVESVKGQLAADWFATQDSNSRVASRGLLHGPLARLLLKEKTNPEGMSETGLRITIRESKCGQQDWSLASPSPLRAQNQFHGSLRPYISLGAGAYDLSCRCDDFLFEGKLFLEETKAQFS